MLVENTIWGERNKVQIAIERLQQFEPPEGYYVAISGGKDSTVVYDLVKKAKVRADFHYSVTFLDAPETVCYIKKHMPDVKFEYPPRTFWELVLVKKMPPTRISRARISCIPSLTGRTRTYGNTYERINCHTTHFTTEATSV